ncbi:hypothetical protein L2E82_47875 [Cichorium intybus]|uniref:Uncharacterized protein n=1 Tax=Cichorium intybus TaxID=13427 RepID=A0ACB8Z0V3_CICIN|nr:hypothetical protein L2E82_47875 [Cichorium intybus]
MKPKSCNVDDDWRRWIGPLTTAIRGGGSQAQTTSTTTIGGGGYDQLIPVASDQFYKFYNSFLIVIIQFPLPDLSLTFVDILVSMTEVVTSVLSEYAPPFGSAPSLTESDDEVRLAPPLSTMSIDASVPARFTTHRLSVLTQGQNIMGVKQLLKNLNAFPLAEENLLQKAQSDAVGKKIAFYSGQILFKFKCWEMVVDLKHGETLPIHINMSFPSLPYQDAIDISGKHEVDLDTNIWKLRLNKDRVIIGTEYLSDLVEKGHMTHKHVYSLDKPPKALLVHVFRRSKSQLDIRHHGM